MTTKTDNGRGAFPNNCGGGMTLRDWFAGLAMQGLQASADSESLPDPAIVAREAYKQADAMLAEKRRAEG